MSDDGDSKYGGEIVDGLTKRERKVLKERFGIENLTDHSLEQVGAQFDITRERIREIERKALKKLYPDDDPNNNDPKSA